MKGYLLGYKKAPNGNIFRRGGCDGIALLLHKQVHDPSKKKNEQRSQSSHHGSYRNCFAETPFFFLAVVCLMGEVAHHHSDADCRNDVKCGCTEGRNHEPSPQHAQGVAVQDGAEDHQKSNHDDTAKNSQCDHVRLLKVQCSLRQKYPRDWLSTNILSVAYDTISVNTSEKPTL